MICSFTIPSISRLVVEGIEKVEVFGCPAEVAELRVLNGLVGPSAFAGEHAFASRRKGFVEVLCESLVAFELAHRFVVGDVVDPEVLSLGEKEACAGRILDVDLI